jgi:signal transduction histidine kinase
VHPAPLQMQDFVRRLKDEYASRAKEMGLRFECSIAEHEIQLISDPEKLHEIANILLSNAFKYTRSGYVRLEVIEIPDHDRWKLRVIDSGVGIDVGRARNLFHEFHSDHTPASEGLHLGLVLGRYLARLLGGDLTYQPGSTGVGNSFELNLPRISPAGSASAGGSP